MMPLTAAWRWMRRLLPVALAVSGIVLLLNLISFAFGAAPFATLRVAAAGTWGTAYGIGQVLFKATPLIFTAVSFEIGLRAGLFNIGAEGQLAIGGLVGSLVAARLPPSTPSWIAIPIVLLVAMLGGAMTALIPAILRAKRGVHEIITTIMMNRIAEILVPYLLVVLASENSVRTADIVSTAALPKLSCAFPALSGSAASFAFLLAALVVVGAYYGSRRLRVGREMGWMGLNLEACRAEGIPVERRMVEAMLISGALAGAVMSATILGYKGYFELGLGAGSGFTGIAVALLGRGHPVGILLSALVFGTLDQAGLSINARVPREAMSVLSAVAIVLVAGGTRGLRTYRPLRPSVHAREASR